MRKICTVCSISKVIEKFSKNKRSKDGFHYRCKACDRAYKQSKKGIQVRKRYEQSTKGKQARKVYFQSKSGRKALKRHWQSEKGKETKRQYKQSNKKKIKKYQQEYQRSEKGKQALKRFWQSTKGRQARRKTNATRSTQKTQAGGSYTIIEWYRLCKFYDFRCLKCNEQMTFEKLTFDHIKPISKGGTSFVFNAQPLCFSCNASKGNKEIDYRQTLPDWIKHDGSVWIQDRLF